MNFDKVIDKSAETEAQTETVMLLFITLIGQNEDVLLYFFLTYVYTYINVFLKVLIYFFPCILKKILLFKKKLFQLYDYIWKIQ